MAGRSRRRNLRQRKQATVDPREEPQPRKSVRQSRGRVEPDFIVYDDEEDEDWPLPAAADDADDDAAGGDSEEDDSESDISEAEEVNVRSRRAARSARSSVRSSAHSAASTRSSRSSRNTRSTRSSRKSSGDRASDRCSRRSGDRNARSNGSSRAERALRRRGELLETGFDSSDDSMASEDENPLDSESESDDDAITSRRSCVRAKAPPKRVRKPKKILLPEDVFGREPVAGQPSLDLDTIEYSPSIAFLAIFVATFTDLFSDLPSLPAPQDIEEGLQTEQPSPLVEFLLRRLLGLILNRKKEIEVGKYGSALSELHSLRNTLGIGTWFPPLNWKSYSSAFQELNWADRLEFLHVLVHWSLQNSDQVKAVLRSMGGEFTMPWMGADSTGTHYYIVGFDPVAEGSQEYTRFRIYRESNRLLSNVKWEPVASDAAGVAQFLADHEIKDPEVGARKTAAQKEAEAQNRAAQETAEKETAEQNTEDQKTEEQTEEQTEGTQPVEGELSETVDETAEGETVECETMEDEAAEAIEEPPVKYSLPDTVVEILTNLLPTMYESEQITATRIAREAKRARRRHDIAWQSEAISNGNGRHSSRRRRNRVDFADFVRRSNSTYDVDSDEEDNGRRRKRRLRDEEAWLEPEPETRQQRHARLLADRMERAEKEGMPTEASVEPSVEPSMEPSGEAYEQQLEEEQVSINDVFMPEPQETETKYTQDTETQSTQGTEIRATHETEMQPTEIMTEAPTRVAEQLIEDYRPQATEVTEISQPPKQ